MLVKPLEAWRIVIERPLRERSRRKVALSSLRPCICSSEGPSKTPKQRSGALRPSGRSVLAWFEKIASFIGKIARKPLSGIVGSCNASHAGSNSSGVSARMIDEGAAKSTSRPPCRLERE
jgi:hypothetical protein